MGPFVRPFPVQAKVPKSRGTEGPNHTHPGPSAIPQDSVCVAPAEAQRVTPSRVPPASHQDDSRSRRVRPLREGPPERHEYRDGGSGEEHMKGNVGFGGILLVIFHESRFLGRLVPIIQEPGTVCIESRTKCGNLKT